MSDRPIAEYAMMSDCHGSGLVHRSGSIDWLCLGRFDAPAVFARLLDEGAGYWSMRPVGTAEIARRYIDRTMIVETTFRTDTGVAVLRDGLHMGLEDGSHHLGAGSAEVVMRRVACTAGAVELEIEFIPRPEYGLIAPILIETQEGLLARGGATVYHLASPVELETEDSMARRVVGLEEGDRLGFSLHHAKSWEPEPPTWSHDEIDEKMEASIAAWRAWADRYQRYDGPWEKLVHHSGRVLQAMTFEPTGAVVAAPTTSLPEAVGGERNWDYRYTWVRDASLTLDALWVAACPDEAGGFFQFMAHAALTQLHRSEDMQIMFGIGGEHDLTERELLHLDGWRDSRPVRVGNGAWDQRQLDVYGALLSAAHRFRDHLVGMDPVVCQFLARLADLAASRWRERDRGIWEIRDEQEHFLHSKLMCWVALDRAIDMAGLLEAESRVDDWAAERAEIREAIIGEGWNDEIGAFTQAFGSDYLDASVLTIPLVGLLPGDDERVLATLETIEEWLTDEHGLVYRYRREDGLAGSEGAFLLCTFWLGHARALAGQTERARETCQRAIDFINDVGLLAEEVDPATGELLGNFPQSFSHIGLVNAAWAIRQAEAET